MARLISYSSQWLRFFFYQMAGYIRFWVLYCLLCTAPLRFHPLAYFQGVRRYVYRKSSAGNQHHVHSRTYWTRTKNTLCSTEREKFARTRLCSTLRKLKRLFHTHCHLNGLFESNFCTEFFEICLTLQVYKAKI